MTATPVPSKQELLDALRASRDEVLATVRALPAARLEEGRYENGWNGRQILAHVASIEWSYPRLIDIAGRAGRTAPAAQATADLPTREMRGGNDAYNDRQVAKRAHLSSADLLAEFETNRAATIAAVEARGRGALRPPHPLRRGASSVRSQWSSIRSRCSMSSATSAISRGRVRRSRSCFEDRQGRAQHLRLGVVRTERRRSKRAPHGHRIHRRHPPGVSSSRLPRSTPHARRASTKPRS